jgi:TonB-linked SusC/RagA family outer membrane protein
MKIKILKHRFVLYCKATFFVVVFWGFALTIFGQKKSDTKAVVGSSVNLDSINGVVYNGISKLPLAGAQIHTIDGKYSAMSDESGFFSIKLPATKKTLLVSAPEFENKEVPIFNGDKKKNITLFPKAFGSFYDNGLTILGMKRNTSIVNSQSSTNVENTSSLSVDAEIQKKLAGTIRMMTHSGTPGTGSFMSIRGVNSLNANTQPLIVIDGVVFENQYDMESIHLGNILNPLANIDVNDVENISVLKDGTSLYGSKGGNGVILITTNRGKGMTTKITASTTIGYNTKPSLTPMMNTDQYRIYLSDLLKDKNAELSLANQFFLNDNQIFTYYNKYHNNTKWSDGIYNSSVTQSYNVGVNGGDESALYNLSMGYTMANSTLKKNDFNRLNARFNSDIILTKKLSTSFDISYSQMDRNLRNDGVAESYATNPIDAPGYLSLIKSPFLAPYQFSNSGQVSSKLENYDFLGIANPYAVIEYGVGHTQQTNFNLALVPQLKLNDNLTFLSRFSYTLKNLSENFFRPMYGVAPFYNINLGINSLNQVKTQFAKQISIFSDTRINWKKNYGFNLVEVNAGVRYINDSYTSDYASGNNTGSDQVREMSSGLSYKTVGGLDDPYKTLNSYAVFNYSFKDRYFIEPTIATETSSRFAKEAASGFKMSGRSWAVFPAINTAWLLTSENFMKNVKFINLLKIRASYGMSGNDGIRTNVANTYFNAVRYANNAIGLQLTNIGNSELQWETVTKRNVGFDASLFNDRLSVAVDFYNNTTDNLLVQKQLSVLTGLDTYWCNDGKLENRGYEVALNAKLIQTKDLNMEVGATISHYANKILALADGDYLTTIYGGEILTAVGQSIGQFYGYKTNGVYATSAEAKADGLSMRQSTGTLVPYEAGDVRFVNNYSDDKVIDEKDKVVIGNSNPDFFGLIHADVKYKKLAAKFIFNYSYGNQIYNYMRSQLESESTFNNQSVSVVNRWVNEGQITNVPKSVYLDPKENNRFSDRWIEDGSFLKLKSIELSYELPVKISFLQGLTVWGSANNLLTLTKYLGQDPEFSTNNQLFYQGIDTGLLPQSKSYFVGLKIYL